MTEQILFGSYEMLERIAEGGMAEVWRARSRGAAGFEKIVVIKRVLPELMANVALAELLIREAKIAARLSHANIVQIFDLGEEQGTYFIAMEYVPGKDLGAALAIEQQSRSKGGTGASGLSMPVKLWTVAQAAKALDYAHRRKGEDGRPLNIVHRDISPQNILLGYEGAVKVTDFGIARADEQGLGRGEDPKVLRGKYGYMSPEQTRGEQLDRRSDLFSLGVVLYEAITGRRLFRGGSATETLALVRAAVVPEIDPDQYGLPPEVRTLIARSLARDRDARYASAGDLFADLSQMLFRMEANVGEPELATEMARLFPRREKASPNKLRVDLLLRAQDDATSLSQAMLTPEVEQSRPGTSAERTSHALPASKRVSSERRRVALLVTRETGSHANTFETAVEAFGGVVLPAYGDLREACFGALGGERAVEHAARAALEVRRRVSLDGTPTTVVAPPMAVLETYARVFGAGSADPDPTARDRAIALLEGAAESEVVIDEEIAPSLGRIFRLGSSVETGCPVIEGYRSRRERETVMLGRRGPLVGRRRELDALSTALARAAEGSGGVVFVVGEAGSGKSRLVAEVRAACATQDLLFVCGRGNEGDLDRAFGALGDLVMDLCGVEDEDTPSERFAKVERLKVLGLAPYKIRLLGQLLGLSYPVATPERAGRPRGIEVVLAIREAVRALARDRVVVLALEDLHWMDDPTRQVMPLLLRGLEGAAVLVVLTARAGSVLPRAPAELLALEPLEDAPARRLLALCLGAREVEDDLAVLVKAATGGNPSWIQAAAAALRDSDAIAVVDGVASADPSATLEPTPSVLSLVAARLAQLKPEDTALLRDAASFRSWVDVQTLAALASVPADQLKVPLRRLTARRLVVSDGANVPSLGPTGRWGVPDPEAPIPARVRVANGFLRSGVLATLTESERRRLHGRVVAVLERAGAASDAARIDELAWHAARSPDRRRAPDYLVEAALAAVARGDAALAAEQYAEAARLLLADGDDPLSVRAVEIGLAGVDQAIAAGLLEAAERLLAELGRAASSRDDAKLAVRLARSRAALATRAGNTLDAVAALDGVRDTLARASDDRLVGEVLLLLGTALGAAGRTSAALDTLREAADTLAHAEDASQLYGQALCALASVLARADRLEEAQQAGSAALAVAARLGHGVLRYASLAAMAELLEAGGSFSQAADRFVEAAELAAEQQLVDEQARMLLRAAIARVEDGEDARGAVHVEDALRLGRERHLSPVTLLATAVQSSLAICASADAEMLPMLARAVERAFAGGRPRDSAIALFMLARAEAALGHATAARTAVARACEVAELGGQAALARLLRDRSGAFS